MGYILPIYHETKKQHQVGYMTNSEEEIKEDDNEEGSDNEEDENTTTGWRMNATFEGVNTKQRFDKYFMHNQMGFSEML